jgi:hypothetical protein
MPQYTADSSKVKTRFTGAFGSKLDLKGSATAPARTVTLMNSFGAFMGHSLTFFIVLLSVGATFYAKRENFGDT